MTTRIQIAKPDIVRHFDEQPKRVFKYREIATILSKERGFWRLAQTTNTTNFIEFLSKNARLKKWEFKFPQRAEYCYSWGEVSLLAVLQHIREHTHFSHYTAVKIHGLTEQEPKSIYITHERTSTSQPRHLVLSQDQIDEAFRRPARLSQNYAETNNRRIYLLNGINTDELGVVLKHSVAENIDVRVTSIERTLIDIAVRPFYSGGVFEVAKAFELAKGEVSINKLAATLQGLAFVYPYHQAIGYYAERAGYSPSQLDLLKRFPMQNDFYLTNGLKAPSYVKTWKLFVPQGL